MDRANAGGNHISGLERVLNFDDDDSGSGDEDDYTYSNDDGHMFEMQNPSEPMSLPQQPYSAGLGSFSAPAYTDGNAGNNDYGYSDIVPVHLNLSDPLYQDPTAFAPQLSASVAPSEHSAWSSEQYSQPPADLSDALGELKINDNGIGKSCIA